MGIECPITQIRGVAVDRRRSNVDVVEFTRIFPSRVKGSLPEVILQWRLEIRTRLVSFSCPTSCVSPRPGQPQICAVALRTVFSLFAGSSDAATVVYRAQRLRLSRLDRWRTAVGERRARTTNIGCMSPSASTVDLGILLLSLSSPFFIQQFQTGLFGTLSESISW